MSSGLEFFPFEEIRIHANPQYREADNFELVFKLQTKGVTLN